MRHGSWERHYDRRIAVADLMAAYLAANFKAG
jgi:hypothetical protein